MVTVEDGVRAGGVGTRWPRRCGTGVRRAGARVRRAARFLEHGKRGEVLADVGLTAQDIARHIVEWTAVLSDRHRAERVAPVERP